MDSGSLALMIPIVAIASASAVKIAKIFVQHRPGPDDDPSGRLEQLEQEVAALRQELSEAQERIDFTERLLSKGQRPDGLAPPGR